MYAIRSYYARFELHTFEEEIEFIRGLNRSTGRNVGLYPEIKVPWFHRRAGKAISQRVLQVLWDYGYRTPEDGVFLQCFDPMELERIHQVLMPRFGMRLAKVQLIAPTAWEETWWSDDQGQWHRYDYDWMLAPGAMSRIAEYAEARITSYNVCYTKLLRDRSGPSDIPPQAVDHRLACGAIGR